MKKLSEKKIKELNDIHGVTYKKYKYTKIELDLIKSLEPYGVTLDEYFDILEAQNNVCAICHGIDEYKRLSIDHNHETGKMRGLLCGKCNFGIGNLRESRENLENAILYLEKYKSLK